jgi:hypothetical protein
MRGTIFSIAVLLALGGCVRHPGAPSAPVQVDAAPAPGPALEGHFYACRTGQQPADAAERAVAVHPDPGSHRLLLSLGADPAQPLEPVAGTAGHLFANSHFAWSLGASAIVLTDIDSVQTYTCRPINYAEAAVLYRHPTGQLGGAPDGPEHHP